MGRLRLILLLAGVACGCAANAAVEWDVEPSFAIAETFTDNLGLAPDVAKKSDFATEVLPAITLTATSEQFMMDFDYRLQGLIYSRSDELDETLSYAKTSGTAKLIGNTVFVDFLGTINQQIVNPGGGVAISGVSRGNRAQAGYASINPYFQRQIGNSSSIRIGYRRGLVEYDDVTLTDSQSDGLVVAISGSPPRSPWAWRIDATNSSIDYDTGSKVELQRVGGEFSWSFGGTALFVGGGDESNEFVQLFGPQKIDGSFWHVGLRGQLDRRTNYSISAGQQHFGDSYQFALQRTAGKLITDISYLEETTTVGQQQQGYEALFEFLTEITGAELPTAGADVYVRKRLSATGTLGLPRSRWRLNMYDENRDYLTSTTGESDGIIGIAVSWTWTALQRTEFSADLGWQNFELRDDFQDPKDLRLQFRVRRDLKNDLFLFTRAWHNRRSAATADREYNENAISIGFDKRF